MLLVPPLMSGTDSASNKTMNASCTMGIYSQAYRHMYRKCSQKMLSVYVFTTMCSTLARGSCTAAVLGLSLDGNYTYSCIN